MNPVQKCIGIVPAKKYEHALNPHKTYDLHNFEVVFRQCIENAPREDSTSYYAFLEIASYLMSVRCFEMYGLANRAGILFVYNGFPYLALGNVLNRISFGDHSTMVLVDMNNYIFNKKFERKLQDLEKAKHRLETATTVFAVSSAIAAFVVIYIFLR